MRLVGGTGAIISTFVKVLPAERLHLNACVTRFAMGDDELLLSVSVGARQEEIAARQAIMALPPRLLASTVDFEPALDLTTLDLWRRTATWMAPHAKFLALYDSPFWRESGLSGTAQSGLGPLGEIHDATSAHGSAALFGFVGLDRRQRVSVGKESLIRASVAQLARLFGPKAAEPLATFFKDWAADSFTSTDADEIAEGHPVPHSRQWIAGKWAQHVSLAGSETSATDPGYLAGALEAAERAVREVTSR